MTKKPQTQSSELLYTSQVAKLLNVSPSTIQRMAVDGRLKPVARGQGTAGLVFARADVDALLTQSAAS